MFPTVFTNDAKMTRACHQAIQIQTTLPNAAVIEGIIEKGIESFLKNLPKNNGYSAYNEHIAAGCCSFSKNNSSFYLYPISESELSNVGLVEEDLVEWIKYLNDMGVGFDYSYFGNQPYTSGMMTRLKESGGDYYTSLAKSKNVYWVGVPRTDAADYPVKVERNTNNIPYLKWIALRYLINTTASNHLVGIISPKSERLGYYNIPRIALFLNKEYKVPKLRAFLYAHLASPFYAYYGLAYTDYMGFVDVPKRLDYSSYQAPCVHMTADQFKQIWQLRTYAGNMNSMLTQSNFEHIKSAKIEGLVNLAAPYNWAELHDLFSKKDYKGFVDAIKASYKTVESNIRGGKKKLVTSKLKTNVRKKVLA